MIDAARAEGYNRAMLPNDPYMLLSAVNMKLRDGGFTLEELCEDEEVSPQDVVAKLSSIGYFYNEERRMFTTA